MSDGPVGRMAVLICTQVYSGRNLGRYKYEHRSGVEHQRLSTLSMTRVGLIVVH
jgi:hypothetical protein